MIKPNDLEKMELGNTDFEKLEEDIDNSIKSFHGWYPWEEAIIRGEYPVSVRNAIGKNIRNQDGIMFITRHLLKMEKDPV